MTGGSAYVLDLDEQFEQKINPQNIEISRVSTDEDSVALKELIYAHLEATDSERAKEILADWAGFQPKFWKIVPKTQAKPQPAVVEEATTALPAPVAQ